MSVVVCDQEARNMARDAVAKIDSHEEVCVERWKASMSTMGEIKSILKWAIASTVSALVAIIGFLAAHVHV